jgi:hypothetical protein
MIVTMSIRKRIEIVPTGLLLKKHILQIKHFLKMKIINPYQNNSSRYMSDNSTNPTSKSPTK